MSVWDLRPGNLNLTRKYVNPWQTLVWHPVVAAVVFEHFLPSTSKALDALSPYGKGADSCIHLPGRSRDGDPREQTLEARQNLLKAVRSALGEKRFAEL